MRWESSLSHVSFAPLPSCRLYVHSAVANWKKCLHSIKLKDSVLSLVYVAPTEGWGQGPKVPSNLNLPY